MLPEEIIIKKGRQLFIMKLQFIKKLQRKKMPVEDSFAEDYEEVLKDFTYSINNLLCSGVAGTVS